jgi:6-phosphogluconolactonase
LNNARQILFLLSGPSKAEILKMILATENSQPKVPAQMVRPTSGQVTWLFDKAAASKLPPEVRFKAFHL